MEWGIGLKRSDVVAFVVLFVFVQLLVVGVAALMYWHLQIGSVAAILLVSALIAALFGYFFARYAYAPLLERNRELSHFVQETLHELNIPLATIRANVELIMRSADAKAKQRLQRIEAAAGQLHKLYESLELFIKGQVRQDRVTFDAAEVLQERIAAMRELYPHKAWEVALTPLRIEVSKASFMRTIDNLLDNACKYSPPKGHIRVRLEDGILCIANDGEAIDEAKLLRIFDRYYRHDPSQPGYGLGLAIVKRFCDEEGIEITITSHEGVEVCMDLTKVKR